LSALLMALLEGFLSDQRVSEDSGLLAFTAVIAH